MVKLKTMIPYPYISPDIFRIGPFALKWYSVMYLLGFAASYVLVRHQMQKQGPGIPKGFLDSLYVYVILGLMLGARLGYVVFYDPLHFIGNPLEIAAVWHGGMSFHGGLIGSVAAGILCCRKYRFDPWRVSDMVMATAPIGLGLGRIGNFINGELYGRITDAPWAMVFPLGGPFPRHPSQLYEFFLEGLVLFTVLWTLKDRVERPGMLTAVFLSLYGVFRVFAEFFREPDPQLGLIAGPFSMGQVLSSLMILAGGAVFYFRSRRT